LCGILENSRIARLDLGATQLRQFVVRIFPYQFPDAEKRNPMSTDIKPLLRIRSVFGELGFVYWKNEPTI
jgi:hypothetical protein